MSSPENKNNPLDFIPPQYKGLPSETLKEIWVNPIYMDEKLNKKLKEERDAALKALAEKENFENQKQLENVRNKIDKQGSTSEVEEQKINPLDFIPPQYKGIPSETLKEIWVNPIYMDEKLNKKLKEERDSALKALKAKEEADKV